MRWKIEALAMFLYRSPRNTTERLAQVEMVDVEMMADWQIVFMYSARAM